MPSFVVYGQENLFSTILLKGNDIVYECMFFSGILRYVETDSTVDSFYFHRIIIMLLIAAAKMSAVRRQKVR